MSHRLTWFGAMLVVCAAACANIWQFSDLQVAPADDASIFAQDSSEDFPFPPERTDAFGGADRVDNAVADAFHAEHPDAVADAFDGRHSDAVAADVSSENTECPSTLCSNGSCVDPKTDPANCGGCGNVCGLQHATAGCTSGMCTVSSCNAGFADCDSNAMNGCETDLSQPAHCGTCNSACTSGMLCSAGSCVSTCSGNMPTLCNGSCSNTTSDVNNCGGCGTKCTAPANAVATCSGSPPTCGFSCNPSLSLCTSGMTCVNVNADRNSCGGCGAMCSMGRECDGGCGGGKHSKDGG